jgi:hypothetical protein
MVAGYRELVHRKEQLIAEDRNVLKIPAIPFSFDIVRPVAA